MADDGWRDRLNERVNNDQESIGDWMAGRGGLVCVAVLVVLGIVFVLTAFGVF